MECVERKVGKERRVPTSLPCAASLEAPNACAVEDVLDECCG